MKQMQYQREIDLKLLDGIEDDACRRYNVTLGELHGVTRANGVVRARACVWRAFKQDFGMSYVAIGKRFQKDHTTVRHAVLRISEEEYKDFRKGGQVVDIGVNGVFKDGVIHVSRETPIILHTGSLVLSRDFPQNIEVYLDGKAVKISRET